MSLMASALTSCSDSDVDALLLAEVEIFSQLAQSLNIPNRAVSQKGIEKLAAIPSQKKLEIVFFLRRWREWISADPEPKTSSYRYNEKATLKKALAYYGLHAHEDFWATITEDQFVEIYNPEMIQTYRSLSFLEISGYSVLDLMTTEWYHLWERPSRVTDELLKTADKYANTYYSVDKFPVKKHLLREVYITGLTEPFIPRATLVEFHHIGTLVNTATNKPDGFILTSTGQIVASGQDVASLDFV